MSLDAERLREEIRKVYTDVVRDPKKGYHFHTGPEYAAGTLGYPREELAELPDAVTAAFAGVGNPLSMGRPEVGAVVHTHSMFATTIGCCGLEIPAVHYMIAATGGTRIPCVPYITYGTQELADAALAALKGRSACLLANHGMIVLGPTLKKAMWLAVEVETLAAQYWRALQIGRPNILSDAQVQTIIEKFRTYGQQPEPVPGCC